MVNTKINKRGIEKAVDALLNGQFGGDGSVVTHAQILKKIGMKTKKGKWNVPYHNHIVEIKKKLAVKGMSLESVRGEGYRIICEADEYTQNPADVEVAAAKIPETVINRDGVERSVNYKNLIGKTVKIDMFGNTPLAIDTETLQAYRLN